MLIRFWKTLHTLYSEDDGHGDGGADGGKVRASELRSQLGATVDEQALTRLLEKHAETLNDNYRLRNERRDLKARLAEVTGKVPADGSVVLTADDAALLDAYKALGKADDLKKALGDRDDYAGQLAKRDRADAIAKAAEAAGYKATVLAQLAGELPLAVKEVGEGKERKAVAYVTDADGKEHRLVDYAERQWADFLPSLAPKQTQGDGVGSPANGRKPATGGALESVPAPRIRF